MIRDFMRRVHADLDVLERRHRPEQLDVLERPRDAGLRDDVRPLGGDVLAVERHRPVVGL